jgi:hypothetical protein
MIIPSEGWAAEFENHELYILVAWDTDVVGYMVAGVEMQTRMIGLITLSGRVLSVSEAEDVLNSKFVQYVNIDFDEEGSGLN